MPFPSYTDQDVLNGFARPEDSTSGIADDNQLRIGGTILVNGVVISAPALLANVITTYSAPGALSNSGKALIVGGTGFTLTLAAPTSGCLVDVLIASVTSPNTVIITAAAGTTFDGTHATATFSAADNELVIGYLNATTWKIFKNSGVVLS